ncbi:hypothetical protein M2267_001640 [Ensifer sp. KUDG1]
MAVPFSLWAMAPPFAHKDDRLRQQLQQLQKKCR